MLRQDLFVGHNSLEKYSKARAMPVATEPHIISEAGRNIQSIKEDNACRLQSREKWGNGKCEDRVVGMGVLGDLPVQLRLLPPDGIDRLSVAGTSTNERQARTSSEEHQTAVTTNRAPTHKTYLPQHHNINAPSIRIV